MKEEIAKPYDITYVKALQATRDCGFKIENEEINSGLITFKVGISFASWGERFHVQLTKLEQYRTLIEVRSENFQIGSWGKHEKNINDFFTTLKNLLKK